jgi:hypothetical protein
VDWIYESPLPEGLIYSAHTDIYPNGLRDTSDPMEMQPSFIGVAPNGIEYRTNAMGYRDDDILPGRDYWVFLGDSTTFGLNIAHEDTYAEQIEVLALADGLNVQSVNTAVPGRGTVNEYDTLLRTIEAGIQPQWVIVGFFANDVRNDVYYMQNHREPEPTAAERVFGWSYLYRIGTAVMQHMQDTQRVSGDDWDTIFAATTNGSIDTLTALPEWQTTLTYLKRIQQTTERQGAQLIVLYIPFTEDEAITGDSPVADVLAWWSVEHQVSFVNGAAVYAAYLNGAITLPEGFYSSPGDMSHPGSLSSKILAQAIYEAMQ